jgi:hypothetical protein
MGVINLGYKYTEMEKRIFFAAFIQFVLHNHIGTAYIGSDIKGISTAFSLHFLLLHL